MKLDDKDRLILYNQYEILKCLDPDESKMYEQNQKILMDGYKYEYGSFTNFIDKEISVELSKFVRNVLLMYRIIDNSYHKLNKNEKEEFEKLDTKFAGFDGNEESDYYSYASFILEDLGEFVESYDNGRVELNSHSNMLNRYKEMIDRWEESREDIYSNLTLDQIKHITQY